MELFELKRIVCLGTEPLSEETAQMLAWVYSPDRGRKKPVVEIKAVCICDIGDLSLRPRHDLLCGSADHEDRLVHAFRTRGFTACVLRFRAGVDGKSVLDIVREVTTTGYKQVYRDPRPYSAESVSV